MKHLAQKEDIQMHPKSTHLLALSEDRNVRVEVLDQGMTSHQSTEDMSEKTSLLHYSVLEYNGCAHFTIDNITIVTQP